MKHLVLSTFLFCLPGSLAFTGSHAAPRAVTARSRRGAVVSTSTALHARRRGGNRKGRTLRRTKDAITTTATTTSTATLERPMTADQYKTQSIGLSIASQQVIIQEIMHCDHDWWDNANDNDNPYGARVWPSAQHLAEFLLSLSSTKSDFSLADQRVLELGCGTGLISIAAAAAGATVVATDICPTCLALTRAGWKQTQQHAKEPTTGRLTTQVFDICGNDPLPDCQPTIVVAGTMLYNAKLAQALARRVCRAKCWVIVGDDDTGRLHDGRALFLQELGLTKDTQDLQWSSPAIIECMELGWKSKQVQVLHLNRPVTAD